MLLKIGQLARHTGLTVRTLHHYDAIGLLRPSGRADNGYRMYDRADVARLHQIQALRRLDLGLDDIKALLAGQDADIGAVVAQQVRQLTTQIEHATLLRDRLLQLQQDFAAHAAPDLREWLVTLELMAVFDKHLTPEETARWHAHNRKSRAEADAWKALVAELKAAQAAGVPPGAPAAMDGARRWLALTDVHLKRSPQLMLKLDVLYREDRTLQDAIGTDPAFLAYLVAAAGHYRLSLYARHLDGAQLAAIRDRYLNQPDGAWVALSRDLLALMDDGAAPSSRAAAALCRRWRALFETCFGSDPDVRARVQYAQDTDPDLQVGTTWTPAMRAYLRAGLAHLDAMETDHA